MLLLPCLAPRPRVPLPTINYKPEYLSIFVYPISFYINYNSVINTESHKFNYTEFIDVDSLPCCYAQSPVLKSSNDNNSISSSNSNNNSNSNSNNNSNSNRIIIVVITKSLDLGNL